MSDVTDRRNKRYFCPGAMMEHETGAMRFLSVLERYLSNCLPGNLLKNLERPVKPVWIEQ